MIDVLIEDKRYKIPTELNIKKFVELVKWDFTNEIVWSRIISESMDMPYDYADEIPNDKKEIIIIFILGLMYPSIYPLNTEYKGNKLIDVNKITIGQFIDLDILLTNGLKNIYKIVEKLYGVKPDDDTLMIDVYPAIQYYINFRNKIYKEYKNLFNIEDEYFGEDMDVEIVPIEYRWYDVIMVLSDEKFLDIERVVERPLKEALNFLSYRKDKTEKEKKYLNELQRNHRIS